MQQNNILDNCDNQLKDSGNYLTPRRFKLELGIACMIAALALIYVIWPILIAPVDSYPVTSDGMGHFARVKYLADSLKEWKWPSWFPYWYSGCTVTQYYPPLSFISMALIQIVIDNIKNSFACLIFVSQFLGAIGVWRFCYRFIAPWVGLIGVAFYALQPFQLRTLMLQGAIAQAPIFALTPWFLYFSLLLMEKRTPKRWLMVCITSLLLLLSQPMHFYLIGICVGAFIVVFFVQHKNRLIELLLWGVAVVLGIGLGGGWAVPGITTLESPLVPGFLTDQSFTAVAALYWFNPAVRPSEVWYPSFTMFVIAFTSIFLVRKSKYRDIIISLLVSAVISVCFSMGHNFPLFKYLPMNNSIITFRFLSFGVLAATLLSVYTINELIERFGTINIATKILSVLIISIIIILVLVDINPRMMPFKMDTHKQLLQYIDQISDSREPFKQGRLSFLSDSGFLGCQVTYFPMLAGLNMADGWSIEGTQHNRSIWLHNVAISHGGTDYVVKNQLQWNVRAIFINNRYKKLQNDIVNKGFQKIGAYEIDTVFYNPTPSSYFLRQERDAIAIGIAAPSLVMSFPWLVQGRSTSLEDYSPKELAEFRLIYLDEPEVKDWKKFENMISELAESGKMVIVSMGRVKTWPVVGIVPYWENISSGASLVPTYGSPFKQTIQLVADPNGHALAMGNLDEVWMEMQVGERHVPAIGYKNVNGHRVYFVGLALDQQLDLAVTLQQGSQAMIPNGQEVASVIEQLMDLGHPNKNFIPAAFPVSDEKWGYDGFSFSYYSEQPSSVLVSVTYTPRWKAKLDGQPLEVSQLENLILLDLPAGSHQVSFHYGMTWVGWLGIAVSIVSLLIVIFIYRRFGELDRLFEFIKLQITRMIKCLGA